MKLACIRVRQFRQFAGEALIEGLDAGLNLFHGPNESGKSTLAQAIRAAFLERHASSTLGYLQPWSDSSAAPEISLEFEFQGRHYRLDKRFLRQRRCDLSVDGQRMSGDEAEAHLASLFGFSLPAKGASRPELWGLPGLLWIEQGAGQELAGPAGHAKEHLEGVLKRALGEVVSTGGDGVVQAVAQAMGQLVTPRTAAPTGDYRKAREAVETLQAQREVLEAGIFDYRDQLDRLESLQEEHQRESGAPSWHPLKAQREQAQARIAQAREQERELVARRELHSAGHRTLALLEQQLEAVQQQETAQLGREAALAQASQASQALREQAPALEEELAAARQAWAQAREAHIKSRQYQEQRERRENLERFRRELQRVRQQCAAAQTLVDSLALARESLSGVQLDPGALPRLLELQARRQALAIRRAASATRLDFDLPSGQSVDLGGQSLEGQGSRLLLSETTLVLPGGGRLRISPGGVEVSALAQEEAALEDDWQKSLAMMGVASLDEAQQRSSRSEAILRRIQEETQLLAVHAPEGVAALRAELAALEQREKQASALLGAPDAQGAAPPEEPDVAAERERLAELRHDEAQARLHAHRLAEARAVNSLQAAQREWDEAARRLRDSRERADASQLSLRLNEEGRRLAALQAEIDAAQQKQDAIRVDLLEQDVERLGRSIVQIQETAAERERQIRELTGRLQALGGQGLEEQLSKCEAQLAAAQRRVAEFERRLAALGLLQALLEEQRNALVQTLQAPLRQRLAHYLEVLFAPQTEAASLELGPGLMPERLARRRGTARLDELSYGAREQIGLISRLAYADVLRQAGRPVLVILDDILVHSDAQRLSAMKRILFDAAQRHQILLFTCQAERWQDMGVPLRDIRALTKAPAP